MNKNLIYVLAVSTFVGCNQIESTTASAEHPSPIAARPLPGMYDIEINAITGPNSGTGINGPNITIDLYGKYNPSDAPHFIQTITLQGNVNGAYRQIIMNQAISEVTSIVVTNRNVAKQAIPPYNAYPWGWVNTDKDWNAQSVIISVTDYNLQQKSWSFNINKNLASRQPCRSWYINKNRCISYYPVSYGSATATGIPYTF